MSQQLGGAAGVYLRPLPIGKEEVGEGAEFGEEKGGNVGDETDEEEWEGGEECGEMGCEVLVDFGGFWRCCCRCHRHDMGL